MSELNPIPKLAELLKVSALPLEAVPAMLGDLKRRKAELIQALQRLKVKARIRGQNAVVESSHAEVCFHCKGQKSCQCALCAVPARQMKWTAGECAACKGTGFLCWPAKVQ